MHDVLVHDHAPMNLGEANTRATLIEFFSDGSSVTDNRTRRIAGSQSRLTTLLLTNPPVHITRQLREITRSARNRRVRFEARRPLFAHSAEEQR